MMVPRSEELSINKLNYTQLKEKIYCPHKRNDTVYSIGITIPE